MGDAEEVPGIENKNNRRSAEDFFEDLSADRRFFDQIKEVSCRVAKSNKQWVETCPVF